MLESCLSFLCEQCKWIQQYRKYSDVCSKPSGCSEIFDLQFKIKNNFMAGLTYMAYSTCDTPWPSTLTVKILLAENLKASAKYCQSNTVIIVFLHESALLAPCGAFSEVKFWANLWRSKKTKKKQSGLRSPTYQPRVSPCQIIIPAYP